MSSKWEEFGMGAVNGWGLVCEQQVGGVWHGSSVGVWIMGLPVQG